VPFGSEPGNGTRLAVGDLEGDGLPDAARDGGPGTAYFWANATPIEPTTRTLTVRLAPTVSGSPATGAIVTGTCGGSTHTRHITSGGKMGATDAYEAHLAWPDCADETVDISVTWPSGAITTHEAPAGETVMRPEEPRWVQPGPGDEIVLDPTDAGAAMACMTSGEDGWTCCTKRCELERPSTGPVSVRLGDQAATSLPAREATWLLVTTPHLPRPGEEVVVHIQHVGDPTTFPGDEASLRHDGASVLWSTVDETDRSMSAVVSVSEDATSLPLALIVDGGEAASWSPTVGVVFDSVNAWIDLYPVRAQGTWLQEEAWEVHVYSMPGIFQLPPGAGFSLWTPQGVEIPTVQTLTDPTFRRTKLTADWVDLTGVDTLLIRDRASGAPIFAPVVQPVDADDVLNRIGSAQCGVMSPRLAAEHGRSPGILTFLDEGGHPMLVPPSL
ncbi:MAG: hypothetical protein QF464_19715, partial [Myxococcota bacterium]|nr:hypothetical protein [Myxococcota bacterium]